MKDLPRYVKVPGTEGAFRVIGVTTNTAGERLAKLARNSSRSVPRNRNAVDAYVPVKDLQRATLREYKAFILEGNALRGNE